MGWEMHVEVLMDTTSSIKIPVKEVILSPWFNPAEGGQCLYWEGGEEEITEMKARNDNLSKYMCNLKEGKQRSGHNMNRQLRSKRK